MENGGRYYQLWDPCFQKWLDVPLTCPTMQRGLTLAVCCGNKQTSSWVNSAAWAEPTGWWHAVGSQQDTGLHPSAALPRAHLSFLPTGISLPGRSRRTAGCSVLSGAEYDLRLCRAFVNAACLPGVEAPLSNPAEKIDCDLNVLHLSWFTILIKNNCSSAQPVFNSIFTLQRWMFYWRQTFLCWSVTPRFLCWSVTPFDVTCNCLWKGSNLHKMHHKFEIWNVICFIHSGWNRALGNVSGGRHYGGWVISKSWFCCYGSVCSEPPEIFSGHGKVHLHQTMKNWIETTTEIASHEQMLASTP